MTTRGGRASRGVDDGLDDDVAGRAAAAAAAATSDDRPPITEPRG